jgi:hypothetical protein
MAPLYGLTRGRQWVTCPAERRKLAQLPPGSPLLTPAGDAVWLPGTKLGAANQAWTTTDMETAIARQGLLRILLPGLVTVVQALPHE